VFDKSYEYFNGISRLDDRISLGKERYGGEGIII
jgi:hypothetical protein